jgi:predicted site-specific integrase-resolvase
MKLEKWRKIVGISRTFAWSLRRDGKLPTIVRYETVYVTSDTIRSFFQNDGSKPRAFAMN